MARERGCLMGPLYAPGPSVPLPSVQGRHRTSPGCETDPAPAFVGTTGSNPHLLPRASQSLLMSSYLSRSVQAGLLAVALPNSFVVEIILHR